MRRRDYLGAAAGTGIGALAGCLGEGSGNGTRNGGGGTGTATDGGTVRPPDLTGANLGYTHVRPDGNRVVDGAAALPVTDPLDVPVAGTPAWVAAAERPGDPGTSVWAVVLADGRVQAFAVGPGGDPEPVATDPDRLPPGTPPLVAVGPAGEGRRGSEAVRLVAPPDGASGLSHPVPVGDALLFVGGDGELSLAGPDGVERLGVEAVPDARPPVADGRAYVPTAPTDRYAHGALGDDVEAGAVTVVSGAGVENSFRTPGDAVFEGVAPILDPVWADPAVVVTLADAERGARVAAFDADGDRVATGPAVGQGFRWRHQLCVAPLGPGGEREAVDVLTPHIGGTVEFYRRDGDDLSIVARQAGYSSHAFGSRNLDGGLAVDADGDGRLEVLVPTDGRDRLGAVRHDDGGASVVADVPVGGRATTNLAAAPRGDRVAVGVGRTDALRVW